ncbi:MULTISPECIES: hypothetical protein [unclassified Synechocystis]|uniref:hypothetical protein n=1 Tax=unclassified Synechocystis TaxID=2640012 RepID=UPI00041A81C3|nr:MULTISPECIES: hypothetical protein [unclassified Synechocystis]AIE73341.1 hypothetical protein D082_08120 [Synechocystis sp. PCC 6714]MCT0253157.1 hypothetical protein [Synechocystis sp. CS-94]
MNTRTQTKIIHEGNHMAEIEVELTYTDHDWSPYLSLIEAQKLDQLRLTLRKNNIKTASRLARIYHLTPVVVA